jgi:uracil-DNA glycosylase family protein
LHSYQSLYTAIADGEVTLFAWELAAQNWVRIGMAEPASAHEPYYNKASVPDTNDLKKLATAAKGCEACHLWLCGTQTVFGEGPRSARVMMVGEQPGDKEDLAGRPFVGPAGQLLNLAMEEAGLDRSTVYVTNAVKHFKWETGSGGKRIHGKPNRKEVIACKPWLEAEIASIQPDVIVLLGATAAQAILGLAFRLTQNRGQFFESPMASRILATIHPSAILRMRTSEERSIARAELVHDLKLVVTALKEASPSSKFKLL